jgi:heterodisulfide reductase subunit B2
VNNRSNTYSYFPGCSAHSTGLEYGLSTESVFKHLDLELVEIPAWNCCGASSAHSLDHTLAVALPARNLAIAQAYDRDLVTPCAACYSRMKGSAQLIKSDAKARAEIEEVLETKFTKDVTVRPLLGVLYEDYGLENITAQVVQPLKGLKVVTYYGCLLVRPPEIAEFDDPENPQIMGLIMSAIGAQVMPWSYATDCCGGSLSLSRSEIVQGLVSKIVAHAAEAGADALVTACPLCQVNLEMRQTEKEKMPAFYFTELLGLAFGLKETNRWWSKHLIDPKPILQNAGVLN